MTTEMSWVITAVPVRAICPAFTDTLYWRCGCDRSSTRNTATTVSAARSSSIFLTTFSLRCSAVSLRAVHARPANARPAPAEPRSGG